MHFSVKAKPTTTIERWTIARTQKVYIWVRQSFLSNVLQFHEILNFLKLREIATTTWSKFLEKFVKSTDYILILLKMMPLKALSKETVTSICCFPHMTSRSTILAMSLGRSLCQNSRLFPLGGICACVLHEKTWNSKKKTSFF